MPGVRRQRGQALRGSTRTLPILPHRPGRVPSAQHLPSATGAPGPAESCPAGEVLCPFIGGPSMYSVVVLMALSTSVDTPDFGRRGCRGGNGCHRCMGGRWGGCRGGWGGGCHGGGGCYGGGYMGGCHGGYAGGCHGGGGCYGGGYGGGCHGCGGGYVMPTSPMPMPMPEGGKKTAAPAPATIVVTLPADAKLTIDDYATTATSGRRTFVSPALDPGKDYVYTLKADVMRDNKPVTVTREARVRAGETTTVSMDLPPAAVAAR